MRNIKKECSDAKSVLKRYLQFYADNASDGLASKKKVIVTDDLVDRLFTKLENTITTAIKTESYGRVSLGKGRSAERVAEETKLTYGMLNKYK